MRTLILKSNKQILKTQNATTKEFQFIRKKFDHFPGFEQQNKSNRKIGKKTIIYLKKFKVTKTIIF